MFDHTVVAVHFESPYQPLLDSLSELHRLGARRFTLVDVLRIDDPDDLSEDHRAEARRRLEQKRADLKQAGFEVDIQQPVGFPAPELAKIGRGYGAQLIVLGSRGEGLLREFYHGSTVLELARQTALPVLMERIDPNLRTAHGEVFQRPLLATDFSKKATAAEALALDIGKAVGRLTVVHVVEDDTTTNGEGRDSMDGFVALAKERGIEVDPRIDTGTPDRVIRNIAEKEGNSVVVIGKRGDGNRDVAIGGTAQGVCRNSPSSVLLVPNEQGIWVR